MKKKLKISQIFLYFLPTLLWMVFIFYLSSRQTTGIQGTQTQRFLFFKSLHVIEYALLFFISYFSFSRTISRCPKTSALLLSCLYSLTDEVHQSFVPGRNARLADILIDWAGIFSSFFFCSIFFSLASKKKK